jgi:hypothetical protein
MTDSKKKRGGARPGAGRPRKEKAIAKHARRAIAGTGRAVLGWHEGDVVTMAVEGSETMTPSAVIEKILSRMQTLDDERTREFREQVSASLLASLGTLDKIAEFLRVDVRILMDDEIFRAEWLIKYPDSTLELLRVTQKSNDEESMNVASIR